MKRTDIFNDYAQLCRKADHLEPELFDRHEVQRGLRDKNGNGVVTGLTNISKIEAFKMVNQLLCHPLLIHINHYRFSHG